MNKLEIAKILLITLLFCLLIWDGLQYLTGHQLTIPQSHKQLLGTTALLGLPPYFLPKTATTIGPGNGNLVTDTVPSPLLIFKSPSR